MCPSGPKRARANSGLAQTAQPNQDASGREDSEVAVDKEESLLPVEVIARHIASHLQGLTLLTTRLVPIHKHDDSDNVSPSSSAGTSMQSSINDHRLADEDSRQAGEWNDGSDYGSDHGDTDMDYEPPLDVEETGPTVVWNHIPLSKDLPTRQEDNILRHLQQQQRDLLPPAVSRLLNFSTLPLSEQSTKTIDQRHLSGEADEVHRSLYHICISLKQRLAQVPGFDPFLEQLDPHDPVNALWNLFRKGYPLLTIYNSLRPVEELKVDDLSANEARNSSIAIYKFVQACRTELQIPPSQSFVLIDLKGDDTSGFVKVGGRLPALAN